MVMENLRRIIREDREEARQEGKQEGKQEGRKEAIKQVIEQMLINKMKNDVIKKITNIDDKELKKIKKEIENENFI